jgi:hypothetical protein
MRTPNHCKEPDPSCKYRHTCPESTQLRTRSLCQFHHPLSSPLIRASLRFELYGVAEIGFETYHLFSSKQTSRSVRRVNPWSRDDVSRLRLVILGARGNVRFLLRAIMLDRRGLATRGQIVKTQPTQAPWTMLVLKPILLFSLSTNPCAM